MLVTYMFLFYIDHCGSVTQHADHFSTSLESFHDYIGKHKSWFWAYAPIRVTKTQASTINNITPVAYYRLFLFYFLSQMMEVFDLYGFLKEINFFQVFLISFLNRLNLCSKYTCLASRIFFFNIKLILIVP